MRIVIKMPGFYGKILLIIVLQGSSYSFDLRKFDDVQYIDFKLNCFFILEQMHANGEEGQFR